MDETASTTDGLGCVDPDGAPGAEALVESSPATAVAAAGGGDSVGCIGSQSRRESGPVEVVITGGDSHKAQDIAKENMSINHVWSNLRGYVREYLRL